MNKTHKVQVWTDVDAIFDGLDEGGRQHLANKLNKHGYINHKLFNDKTVNELLLEAANRVGARTCIHYLADML